MRLSLGSRRITSRDLQIVEATDELLAAEIPDPEPNGEAGNVSLLRGFKATIPSSEQGKTRRRKTRNVDAGHLGLAELGKSARGMLEDGSAAGSEVENPSDRKGKRKPRQSFATSVTLGRDELERQKSEILLDKENIHVRRVSTFYTPMLTYMRLSSIQLVPNKRRNRRNLAEDCFFRCRQKSASTKPTAAA